MSVKIMGQVWELALETSQQIVLLAMADHADHDGRNVFPSTALIAWKTGLSERHTRRVIDQLAEMNILQVAKKRPGMTTIYHIHCENGTPKQPLKRVSDDSEGETPDTMSPLTPDVTPTPDTAMSPEPSYKPSQDSNYLSAPLSSESVPDDLDNTSQDNQSGDNIQFMIDITEQLSQLKLTTSQRTVLTAWLISNAHNPTDFAPYTGKKVQVMNNLVKQGYLSTDDNGTINLYSTRLQCTQPKSILFSLTYADMNETPPAGKKDTDKPFWEGVAAMYCWNDNGLDDWRKYVEVASREQLATLNAKIKDTCLALDALHLDDPFSVEEFRWIINHWLHTKFKTVPIAERRFAVSGEAIANNWNAMRVSFKLHKQQTEG